ncbi:MAG TPA: peptidylprolyl isomerase [Solirubrobacteraceae bacterium]|nr:peptidylprolyl isomerase [Solirubrobacteraceae bacterium]
MARPHRSTTALVAAAVSVVLLSACGSSGVPSNAVAVVDGSPITKASFDHWLQIAENSMATTATAAHAPLPVPPDFTACIAFHRTNDPQPAKGQPAPTTAALKTECQQAYTSGLQQTMPFLITADWLQGEAAAQKISVSASTVASQLKQIEAAQFPTPTALAQFLQQSGESNNDLLYRVRVDALSNDLRTKITNGAPKVTPAAIQAYYNAHKSSYGKPETRDLRVVLTSTPAAANRVLALLKANVSFTKVARQFSIDTTTKKSGGALIGQTQAGLEVNLGTAVFAAPLHKVEGPIKTTLGYEIFKVQKITPGTQPTLAQETASITTTLTTTNQNNTLNAYVKRFNAKWTALTNCATGFIVTDCKNAPKTSTTATGATGATG